MAKIRNEDLARLAADVLPERSALSALPAAVSGAGLPAVTGGTGSGLPVDSGGLMQSLPLLGGGAASGTAGGTPGDVANQALTAAFGAGGATATPLSS